MNLNKYGVVSLFLAITFCLMQGCGTGEQGARNVILIIGDGMDDHQLSIARNYLVGARGELVVDTLPHRSAVQVLTVSEDNPNQLVYVADSASSGTAMATGVVTSRGRIGTAAGTGQDITNIIELAHGEGLSTGIVTTASVTDATPATFVAHVNSRGCQGPEQMITTKTFGGLIASCPTDLKANGGDGSIAEQMVDSGVTIFLGGGQKHFQQLAESESGQEQKKPTVLARAQSNGFQVITSKDDLAKPATKSKILGLFAASKLPVRFIGQNGRKAELIGTAENGDVELPAPFICENNPEHGSVPSLAKMTEFAMSHLAKKSDTGFFLMVESASIDKESHGRRPCGSIGEVQQLDEAVSVALEFIQTHPETLLLVTADHAQAAQLIPQKSLFTALNPAIHSPGYFARIRTPEGSVMGVNYATNNSSIDAEHTGAQIPLYAAGAGIEDVPAYLLQTKVFDIIADYLELKPVSE